MLLVFGFAVLAHQPTTKTGNCGIPNEAAWQNYEEYEYHKSVLRLLRPEDRPLVSLLVSLSVFEGGGLPKYFVQVKAPGVFEILRASSAENLNEFMTRLEADCQLPISPRETLKLMNVKWDRKSISPTEFSRIYSSFSKVFTKYASSVETRPTKDGSQITLHSPEFTVLYSTAGFEEFELDSDNAADPIAKWAEGFIEETESALNAHPH